MQTHFFHHLPTEEAALFLILVCYVSKCIKMSEFQNLFCGLEIGVTLTFSGNRRLELPRHSWTFISESIQQTESFNFVVLCGNVESVYHHRQKFLFKK